LLEKYDEFVPDDLLSLDYASRQLDPLRAWNTLRRIVESAPRRTRRQASATVGGPTAAFPTIVVWNAGDWAEAILALPTNVALPSRTVVVPRESVAHALRREIVKAGHPEGLIGTRFVSLASAAVEVLADAGVSFAAGEEALRGLRLRRLFHEAPALRHFPI